MLLQELFAPRKSILKEGIDHPEDLIIAQGSAGAERVVDAIAGLSKDTSTVSIKWDGFPAVVFGRDAQGQLVFVDKHMYDKVAKGRMEFMTIREYDQSRGADRSDLWEKESVLRPQLDKIVPRARDQFWMGDLMWSGTPATRDGAFVFKPNTVEYRVSIIGELGENIARSVGGIAVHTFIPGLGQSDQPLTGLRGLDADGGITFLTGEMRDKPKILVNRNFLKQTQQIVRQQKPAVDKFIADLIEQRGKSILTAMGPFITTMLEDNDIANNIVPRFLEFLKSRLNPAAQTKFLGKNNDGWLYQADGGAPGLLGIWMMWAAVTDLKLHVKEQIDSQQRGSEIVAIIDGEEAHEGYVFGGGKDKLKLVDRLGFSRANFAKHRVPDEEIAQKKDMPMAVFCFGRMNPPTLGHRLVMAKTVDLGRDNAYIFLSNTQNTDTDPLAPAVKAAFIRKIYPDLGQHIVDEPVATPIQAANWLYRKGYRNMTFVAGSDRLGRGTGSIERLLNSWNSGTVRTADHAFGPDGREHVVLNFVSSGSRDPDATDISGISGTLARRFAVAGDEQAFERATGVRSNIRVQGQTLYQTTRQGMGIAEPVEEPQLQETLNRFRKMGRQSLK
jgi:Family of unknown function (DUF6267)